MVDGGPLATRQSVRHLFLTQLGRLLLHISNTLLLANPISMLHQTILRIILIEETQKPTEVLQK